MNTLLLIDGNALIHRAYHALPDFKTKDGVPTNALYGFVSIIYKVVADYSPSHLIVCLDSPGPTFRDKIFEQYRAQRPETERALVAQFPMVKEFLSAAGIVQIEKEGLEADDLIATFDAMAGRAKIKTIILSGDRDLFQLVDSDSFVLTPQIGFSQGKLYDHTAVEEKFGVPPHHIADFKALAGDPSDNYKGVPGIGPKTTVTLIKTWGSVENVYKNIGSIEERTAQKLKNGEKQAILAKKLALLEKKAQTNITLDDAKFSGYDEALKSFFEKYEFRTLSRRYFGSAPSKKPIEEKKASSKDQLGLF